MTLISKTINASIWSSLTEIVAKVISPLVFLILTRILSPEDFGIVAISTTVLSFSYVISDMGISKVLIQCSIEKDQMDSVCNVAFLFNLFIGLLLFACVFIGADVIASFYKQESAVLVIRVMSFQILFYSLSSVQNALRRKNLDFKFLFYIRLITIGTPALLSIPIALVGGGFWAIIAGSVGGSFLTTLALWYSSRWKPQLSFSIQILKSLFSKSIWSTLEQLFVWIPIGLDSVLITRYLSINDLGYYTTSRTMFTTATGLLLAPLLPVLFSALSKLEKDNSQFNKIVFFSHKIVFTIAAFMGVTVFVFRDYIEYLLFNNNWNDISTVFGMIFLIMGVEYFYSTIVEALRANGYFKYIALNTIFSILLTIPILYYSVSFGFITYVVMRGLSLYIYFPGIFYLSAKKCNITFFQCVRNVWFEIVLLVGYGLGAFVVTMFGFSYIVNLMLFLSLFFLFIGSCYIKEKDMFRRIFYVVKKNK